MGVNFVLSAEGAVAVVCACARVATYVGSRMLYL